MEQVEFKLHEVLGRHRIKQTELAEASGVRYATINPLYHGKTKRVDLDTLARLLAGLRKLTGQPYTVSDLLEYRELPGETDPTEELLEAGAADLTAQLNALEADTSPAELAAWAAAFAGKSA